MTFQRDMYIARVKLEGKSLTDPEVMHVIEIYNKLAEDHAFENKDEEWKEHNLEYDLRSTEWILEKVKGDNVYAQHIYAALCNTEWQEIEPWTILKDIKWSCSWRYAGGIIADMLEKGDYIDWYCTGITDARGPDEEWLASATEEQLKELKDRESYLPEGTVTDEVREDFRKLGWHEVTDFTE